MEGGRDGHLYTRLSVRLVGGHVARRRGSWSLQRGLVFSSMLHCMSEQRSEAHFYTLLGKLPCQSSPCWHWNGFLLFEFQNNIPENRHMPSLQVMSKYVKKSSGLVVMVYCLLGK